MVTENYVEHAASSDNNSSDNDDALTSFRYAIPAKGTEKDSLASAYTLCDHALLELWMVLPLISG